MTDPIELAAGRLARKAVEWNPDTPYAEDDIRYGLAVKMGFYFIIVLTVLLGLITNELYNAALSMFVFWLLRNFTGGFHLRLTPCLIVSVTLFCTVPHIPIGDTTTVILTTISLIIVVLCSEKRTPRHLLLAAVLIGTNYAFQSSTIALTILAQSITLIRTRR